MTQWATFVGVTGVVLVLLLVLSHLTQSAFSESSETESGSSRDADSTSDHTDATATPSSADDEPAVGDSSVDLDSDGERRTDEPTLETPTATERESASTAGVPGDEGTADRLRSTDGPDAPGEAAGRRPRREGIDPESLSTGELLANVAISQGLFALVLLGAVIYTGIPADALGIEYSLAYLEAGLLWGTAFGLVLYVANEVGAAAATRLGFDHDEQLRELLAPDSARGWLVLLTVVLPIIAVFEELLFRAALIGVVAAGYGIDPWLLAVVSSVAFALGHGMQGSVGVVVTGLLGFVLAAIFIWTGSFLAVVVAHYLINALEFVVHEGVGFDWADALESESQS